MTSKESMLNMREHYYLSNASWSVLCSFRQIIYYIEAAAIYLCTIYLDNPSEVPHVLSFPILSTREMSGSYSARCGAMKLSTGKVVTEGKEVKKIWQQYTEELYRRDPNATDSFNENIYEDEPEVMEIEVKEALRHILIENQQDVMGYP